MASIRKQKSGTWRVQVRRKGRTVSETFVRYDDAKKWGVDAERQIDRGETPTLSKVGKLQTFGDLIDLHIADMTDVGKPPGRSKDATLAMLKRRLGARNMVELRWRRISVQPGGLAKVGSDSDYAASLCSGLARSGASPGSGGASINRISVRFSGVSPAGW
jgi:hypothetical protein